MRLSNGHVYIYTSVCSMLPWKNPGTYGAEARFTEKGVKGVGATICLWVLIQQHSLDAVLPSTYLHTKDRWCDFDLGNHFHAISSL